MADVELSVIIPDEHVSRVVDAFTAYDDMAVETTVRIPGLDKWTWTFPTRNGDTAKVFGENVLRAFVRAIVRSYEYGLDEERYDTEIDAVDPADQSVPDEIVE